MTNKELRTLAKYIAEYLKEDEPKQWMTSEEKAKQMHISVDRLRKTKDRYEYYVVPGSRRLLFKP